MTYDNTTANTDESLAVDTTKERRSSSDTNVPNERQLENAQPQDKMSTAQLGAAVAANVHKKEVNGDKEKEEEVVEEELISRQVNIEQQTPNTQLKPSTSSSSTTSTSLADNLTTLSSTSSKQDVIISEQQQQQQQRSCPIDTNVSDQLQQIGASLATESEDLEETKRQSQNREESEPSLQEDSEPLICYDPVLDNEIRNRLDKLNALSDLINSLELQFDHANVLFRETLKCSTERLSTIAKTLGPKSIRQGRIYHAARVSVEQSQTDCQRACVQFEQANNDHQFAKLAIKEAEVKLKEINSLMQDEDSRRASTSLGSINICGLKLNESQHDDGDGDNNNHDQCKANFQLQNSPEKSKKECDTSEANSTHGKSSSLPPTIDADIILHDNDNRDNAKARVSARTFATPELAEFVDKLDKDADAEGVEKILSSAKLSEDLNQAIVKLLDAEQKRRQSERMHLNQANKLMIAQENLTKLEREYGNSIRRAQVYFDEARRFNAKLNSVKSDIAQISEQIVGAKRAYARTLNELEQFSEDLHISSRNLLKQNSSNKN